MERPIRPGCQCKARAEAMKRAAAAVLRGDMEAAAIENAFVKRSFAEDAQAMKDYMVKAVTYYGFVPGSS